MTVRRLAKSGALKTAGRPGRIMFLESVVAAYAGLPATPNQPSHAG